MTIGQGMWTGPQQMEFIRMNWPSDRPFPTSEEYEAARQRYIQSIDDYNAAHPDNPDMSDFCCGLDFVMATYNRWLWWEFFYPGEKLSPLDAGTGPLQLAKEA